MSKFFTLGVLIEKDCDVIVAMATASPQPGKTMEEVIDKTSQELMEQKFGPCDAFVGMLTRKFISPEGKRTNGEFFHFITYKRMMQEEDDFVN